MSPRSSHHYDLPILTLALLALISLFFILFGHDLRAAQDSSVFSDFRSQSPGRAHRITIQDLPKPFATPSADAPSHVIKRPANAWPKAPSGFSVQLYATGLHNPRLLRTAPGGDVFLVESQPGNIKVLRGIDAKGGAQQVQTFATGLDKPFGIAFYPPGPEPQ